MSFCEQCDSKGVRHKRDCPTLKKEPVEEPKVESIEDFKKETREGQSAILELLSKLSDRLDDKVVKEDIDMSTEMVQCDSMFQGEDQLPSKYQQVFEKYFDPSDGFQAALKFPGTEKGDAGGVTFTIYVPEKFSNTSDAHRAYYKRDYRTRALQPHNIGREIEHWCKLVCQNLHYNKDIKLK